MSLALDDCPLEKWPIYALGCRYMGFYEEDPESPELEEVIRVLIEREFSERLKSYKTIQWKLKEYILEEEYERAAVYRDALEYFKRRVLD